MRTISVTIHEPGEVFAVDAKGKLTFWEVLPDGTLTPTVDAPPRGRLAHIERETDIDTWAPAVRLSVRAYNVLMREGIKTMGGLIALYDEQGEEGLRSIRNVGDKAATELLAAIREWKATHDYQVAG